MWPDSLVAVGLSYVLGAPGSPGAGGSAALSPQSEDPAHGARAAWAAAPAAGHLEEWRKRLESAVRSTESSASDAGSTGGVRPLAAGTGCLAPAPAPRPESGGEWRARVLSVQWEQAFKLELCSHEQECLQVRIRQEGDRLEVLRDLSASARAECAEQRRRLAQGRETAAALLGSSARLRARAERALAAAAGAVAGPSSPRPRLSGTQAGEGASVLPFSPAPPSPASDALRRRPPEVADAEAELVPGSRDSCGQASVGSSTAALSSRGSSSAPSSAEWLRDPGSTASRGRSDGGAALGRLAMLPGESELLVLGGRAGVGPQCSQRPLLGRAVSAELRDVTRRERPALVAVRCLHSSP